MNPQEVITRWQLQPHPEGGYYRELYRSPLQVSLPEDSGTSYYNACTHIYWVLSQGDFSAWHRVQQGDEIWHWYGGDALELHTLNPDYHCHILSGEQPCAVVPAGVWQAARLVPGGEWVWCGCTVSPGFSFTRFDLGERAQLIQTFPQHRALIEQLTR
jgi:predicted cupin superfamily sugar epimerase